MSIDVHYMLSMAKAHIEAAEVGKPQHVNPDVAQHMGAFEETSISYDDAEQSIHDLEVYHV